MANDLNQCNFIGRAGRDCELRYTTNGNPVANFPLAMGRTYKKSNGETQEETTWVNLVIFGALSEQVAAKHITKGKQVFISGRLQTRKWQDQNGIDRYTTEVVVDKMQMLGRASDGSANQGSTPAPDQAHPQQGQPEFDPSDEIPF